MWVNAKEEEEEDDKDASGRIRNIASSVVVPRWHLHVQARHFRQIECEVAISWQLWGLRTGVLRGLRPARLAWLLREGVTMA